MMKHIVLTGGGTAGHVTPNIALLPALRERGWEISYIGSKNGMEKQLAEAAGLPYYGISSGKLRRYIDLKNLSDPFRVLKGIAEAKKLLKTLNPDVIFSKGGFVAVPVALAAKSAHIPLLIHESDMTPGLANKLAFPAAAKVCCNFPETKSLLPPEKAVVTGTPIRQELLAGSAAAGRAFCGFTDEKPVLLVTGGSLGSVAVNNAIRGALPELLPRFQIIHLCGRGNLDSTLEGTADYVQYEFISEELPDLFAAADIIVSRAGANAICEISALAKPNLLIPLPAESSRGDQILNARSFENQGFSRVVEEKDLTKARLLDEIGELYENRSRYTENMKNSGQTDAIGIIVGLIEECARK